MKENILSPRRLGGVSAALFLALGVAGLWTMRATHQVTFTQADVQSRIDRQLGKDTPIKGSAQILLQSVRVKAATVTLRDGQASLSFDIEGALRAGKKFELEATATGAPKYSDGALFLEPESVEVSRLSFSGQTASDFVARLAEGHIPNGKARQFLEDKARKADDWALAAADDVLRRFLEERPIYRLKDDTKNALLKAVLEQVSVENDRILVTFSLWRFTVTTVAGLFSLVFGIALSLLILRIVLLGEDIEISAP